MRPLLAAVSARKAARSVVVRLLLCRSPAILCRHRETWLERADEMLLGVLRFAAFLRKASLDATRLRLLVAPCATHSAAAWAARLPNALTFLFGDGSVSTDTASVVGSVPSRDALSARLVNRAITPIRDSNQTTIRFDQRPDVGCCGSRRSLSIKAPSNSISGDRMCSNAVSSV